jgi:hypothetical protein
MQMRRRDGLRWDIGNTLLLSGALSLLLFAFVFYDRPITNNTKISAHDHIIDLDHRPARPACRTVA